MHRLLVETELLELESPELPKEALRHLKVLRPKAGEEIELFDGRGKWRVYLWRGALFANSSTRTFKRSNNSLTLFACVTKGSRWDWTIEKATELGVSRIVPVISDRTIVRIPKAERAAKRERWQRIAEDAARQSDAKWLPEICEAVDFKDALPHVRETTCFIGALTAPPSPHLLSAIRALQSSNPQTFKPSNPQAFKPSSPPTLQPSNPQAFSTFIGPEGDFTPEELSSLMAIATPTSFGPTVLRAETAAVFALSVLVAQLNDSAGK